MILVNDSAEFWSAASRPRYPHAKYLQQMYNRPQPVPEPEAAIADPIEAVAALDTVGYARNRDAILAEFAGGPRSGEWLGGVEKGTGRPALTAEEQTALGLGYGAHAHPSPPSGRTLDSDYQQAQHYAAANTSLAAHRDFTTTER